MNLTDRNKTCAEKLPEFDTTEIKAIEESTIGQHKNHLYNIHKADRMTASQFGLVSVFVIYNKSTDDGPY